jgi:ubiquinone biosynthesis protein COQ9
MFDPPERHPDRDAAIDAMLPHVPFDGWTKRALVHGLTEAGLPVDDAELLFPGGPIDMVETFIDLADRRMAESGINLAETRVSARVRAMIALRLRQNRPHKEAIRRAAALLALPRHARAAAGCTARTVDLIWHLAGDRSADFSWYTKRAILAGVYGAVLLYWLRDVSEDDADTLAFLDRRMADVGRIGKARGRLSGMLPRLRPA